MITAVKNSMGHVHLFLDKLSISDLDISCPQNIRRKGILGNHESEGYLQVDADIEALRTYLPPEDQKEFDSGWPVYLEDPGYLDRPIHRVLEELLSNVRDSSLAGRILDYLNSVPIVWDIRKAYAKEAERYFKRLIGTKNHLEKLTQKDFLEALRKGFQVPYGEIFIWVSPDGKVDYGVVQKDFWTTLWVTRPEDVTPEKIKEMAGKKLFLLRQEFEYAYRQSRNPFLSKMERAAWKYRARTLRHPTF